MLTSPYSPGSGLMPPLIVGRTAQITRARATLARLHTDGRPANPLVLTGPRGVGKTVLLRAVEAEARQAGTATVFLTLDRGSSAPERLAAGIAHELHALVGDRGGARWARLRERISAFSLEITVPGVKVARSGGQPTAVPIDRDELARLITEAAAIARDNGHSGLLIVIDEFQEAPSADLVVLVNTIQDTVGLNGAVALVAGGLPQTPDALMAAGSFAERFTYLSVGRLQVDEALLALVEPARTHHVSWSSDAAEAVLEKANGSPYLLQLFGDGAWEVAQPDAGDTISADAATEGLRATEAQLGDGMFRGRWNKAGPAERDLLAAVAATLRTDGTATTRDISDAIGKNAQQLSGARQRLIDKGILEPAGHGLIAFTMPGFEDFVRAESAPEYTSRTTDLRAGPHLSLASATPALEEPETLRLDTPHDAEPDAAIQNDTD